MQNFFLCIYFCAFAVFLGLSVLLSKNQSAVFSVQIDPFMIDWFDPRVVLFYFLIFLFLIWFIVDLVVVIVAELVQGWEVQH